MKIYLFAVNFADERDIFNILFLQLCDLLILKLHRLRKKYLRSDFNKSTFLNLLYLVASHTNPVAQLREDECFGVVSTTYSVWVHLHTALIGERN